MLTLTRIPIITIIIIINIMLALVLFVAWLECPNKLNHFCQSCKQILFNFFLRTCTVILTTGIANFHYFNVDFQLYLLREKKKE